MGSFTKRWCDRCGEDIPDEGGSWWLFSWEFDHAAMDHPRKRSGVTLCEGCEEDVQDELAALFPHKESSTVPA